MFEPQTYVERRERLKKRIRSGVVLFLGNSESPMNYPDNPYPFRQDSTFLYFWGLDAPGGAALIDADKNLDLLFTPRPEPDSLIWSGPQTPPEGHAGNAGAESASSWGALLTRVAEALARNRTVHFLPQYRTDNILKLAALLDVRWDRVGDRVSTELIRAVVDLRSRKAPEEISEIEKALAITRDVHLLAMTASGPGVNEREVVGAMAALAYSRGAPNWAFPPIFTTEGHILHNPRHRNTMQPGDLVINDTGLESPGRYAADITRTFPVDGRFTAQQREIYAVVHAAIEKAIASIRPGAAYREIHLQAARDLTEGLKALGLMKGDVDAAVAAGAHALFFPCGVGHMMGLDAHDMENLGEDYVGYTADIRRSRQFGLDRLRLAKPLEAGFVVTVEPGIYFNPPLMDRWKSEGMHDAFIDYKALEAYRDFGGVRIEEDVLVEERGARVLGPPLAKTMGEVEAISSQRSERS